jgi:hypothetical protein
MRSLIRNFLYLLILGISLGPLGFAPPAVAAGPEIRTDDLELTPDQVQTLKTLNQEFQREQTQIRRKVMIRRMELRTLNAEEIRADKGEEIRREIQALLFQARERSLYFQQEAILVLTPEQRRRLSVETDLGFHCGGWFRRGGRWGMGTGSGGPPPLR